MTDSCELDRIARDKSFGHLDVVYTAANLKWVNSQLDHVLEMSTNIVSTGMLLERSNKVTVVEGAQCKCDELASAFPEEVESGKLEIHCSLFEDFAPTVLFSDVILFRTLEHLADPQGILLRVRKWLRPDGSLYVSVPNATSLHKRIGLRLGQISSLYELTEGDKRKGHLRIYDRISLYLELSNAGFDPVILGSFLKILPDAAMLEMSQYFTPEFMGALAGVTTTMDPYDTAELVAICRRGK